MRLPALLLASILLPVAWQPLGAVEESRLKVTVHVVWGTDAESDDKGDEKKKIPKELEKLLEALKKAARKRSFRLDGKPETLKLSSSKPVKVKLPDRSEIEWTLLVEDGKSVVRQVLTRANGEKSEVKLRDLDEKKEPRINVITRGKETLLLVAQFEKATN